MFIFQYTSIGCICFVLASIISMYNITHSNPYNTNLFNRALFNISQVRQGVHRPYPARE